MEQYNVTGMSCAACSARVEKAVSKVPGVTSCSVSLLTNSMGVEGTADEAAVIAAVEAAGYGSSTRQVSATRSYPNLASQDTANIPKSIEEDGRTLTLQNIDWRTDNTTGMSGYAIGDRYTAVATYTGTATSSYEQEEYVLYGTYEPLSVTITHLLNNKSGIDFSSYAHTGLPVAVFAQGVGQENFGGFYDNTDIYHKLADLMDIQ